MSMQHPNMSMQHTPTQSCLFAWTLPGRYLDGSPSLVLGELSSVPLLCASASCLCSVPLLYASTLCLCFVPLLFASALCLCSVPLLCASALCLCSVPLLCASALCLCSVPLLYASALCLCSVPLLCASASCLCSVPLLCASALCLCSVPLLCSSALCLCFMPLLCASALCLCSVPLLCASALCLCSVPLLCASALCLCFVPLLCALKPHAQRTALCACPHKHLAFPTNTLRSGLRRICRQRNVHRTPKQSPVPGKVCCRGVSVVLAETDIHAPYMTRVGQNHIYTVYIRHFWQRNHQIYGRIRCIYTVLVNPIHDCMFGDFPAKNTV